jgi:hypothetical protein
MQTDTVEQTIEKLMKTVDELMTLGHAAINFIDYDKHSADRMHLRDNLLNITKRHNEQY